MLFAHRCAARYGDCKVARGTERRRDGVGVHSLHPELPVDLVIKNDCVSLQFVADANKGAVAYARGFLASGILALFAIALPPAVGMGRNFLSWWKASKQPPLQPGHEFDGWSEVQVTSRVTIWQCAMVLLSAVLFSDWPLFQCTLQLGVSQRAS